MQRLRSAKGIAALLVLGVLLTASVAAALLYLSAAITETHTVDDHAVALERMRNLTTPGGMELAELPTHPVLGVEYQLSYWMNWSHLSGVNDLSLNLTWTATAIQEGALELHWWDGDTWSPLTTAWAVGFLSAEVHVAPAPTESGSKLVQLSVRYLQPGTYEMTAVAAGVTG